MNPGDALRSDDGRYQAILQGDGNFALYGPDGASTWSSQTAGSAGRAVMQGDGNFVVYNGAGGAAYSTNTAPCSSCRLALQNDGNLVLYSRGSLPLWTKGQLTGFGQDTLPTNASLAVGEALWSSDGSYSAIFQSDNNFVVYAPGQQAIWDAASGSSSSGRVTMQGDGNLVVYDGGNVARFSTSTAPCDGCRLVLQSDGNLVVYLGGTALWSSKGGRTGAAGGVASPGDDYPSKWRDIAQDSVFDDWREYNRECTSFAAWRLHARNGFEMPFNANARDWGTMAAARGFTVDSRPAVGAIAWSQSGDHVAWVSSVSGTTVGLEEYNYDLHGHYNSRTVSASGYRYIHFKDL